METFLDGGLFELAIAILFAACLNFIFLKKYLLILYSVMIILGPVALFFIGKNEWYYWLVIFNLLNGITLVSLLWKEKNKYPQKPLFDVAAMRIKLKTASAKIATIVKNIFTRKNTRHL